MQGKQQERELVVTIVGRPNVGKSTIFNRLLQRNDLAITHDMPGVTRDLFYAYTNFEKSKDKKIESYSVILVDTGGFFPQAEGQKKDKDKGDVLWQAVRKASERAILQSDLVLLVVDVRDGLLPADSELVKVIRKERRPFLVLVNKCDSIKQSGLENDFWNLGVEQKYLFPISAAHGAGFSELKEGIFEELKRLGEINNLLITEEEVVEERVAAGEGVIAAQVIAGKAVTENEEILSVEHKKGIKPREKVIANLAIIGAPNSGKSTLLNRFLGHERSLVSEIPGTTRDPVTGYFDLYFEPSKAPALFVSKGPSKDTEEDENNLHELDAAAEEEQSELEKSENGNRWRSVRIIDTAGIRRKREVQEKVELESVIRALRVVSEANIVLLVIDVTKGIGHQDKRLAEIALEKGKSLIIVLNKVDLLPSDLQQDRKKWPLWLEEQKWNIPWATYCQICPISAKNGKYFGKLKDAIRDTVTVINKKISTAKLNQCLQELAEKQPIKIKRSNSKGKGVERTSVHLFKIKYASIVKMNPPTILIFSNHTYNIPETYRRYLVNGIREKFKLINTPVHLIFRSGH